MLKDDDLKPSTIFPFGVKITGENAKNFTGIVYLSALVSYDSPLKCIISNVTFEPGCRNKWHKHAGGQVLLVTLGRGWYQEEGKEPRELHPGDVVEILPNVKHWHGAASDSWFSHISIEVDKTAGPIEWLEPVTDEEYKKLR